MRRIPHLAATAALSLLLLATTASALPAMAVAAPASGPRSYEAIVDLGMLGGPQDQSGANPINNRGQVAGWSTVNDPFVVHAFLWQHGKMTDLAPLGEANDINDHGQIVGETGVPGGKARTPSSTTCARGSSPTSVLVQAGSARRSRSTSAAKPPATSATRARGTLSTAPSSGPRIA